MSAGYNARGVECVGLTKDVPFMTWSVHHEAGSVAEIGARQFFRDGALREGVIQAQGVMA